MPAKTWKALPKADARLRSWVNENLDGRITVTPISVTRTRLRFLVPCWDLTLDGKPAEADALPTNVDVGSLLGRLSQMQQDGRTPGACILTTPPIGG